MLLVNESPAKDFKVGKDLPHGVPLAPFLFLINGSRRSCRSSEESNGARHVQEL
jgi:hypothetical protein